MLKSEGKSTVLWPVEGRMENASKKDKCVYDHVFGH